MGEDFKKLTDDLTVNGKPEKPTFIHPDPPPKLAYLYCMQYCHPEQTPEFIDGFYYSETEIVNPEQIGKLKEEVVNMYPSMFDVKRLIIMNFNFMGLVEMEIDNG